MSADAPEEERDDRPKLRDDDEGAPLERKRDVLKERIQEVVGASPMGFLATNDIDQPRVRPVAPLLDDLTFWIVTFHDSPKVREINDNPKVSLAFAAMFDEGLHKRFGIFNGRAVGGPVGHVVPLQQQLQARHVGGHVAIG